VNYNLLKAQLEDKIERLEKIAINLKKEERSKLCDEIIEDFYNQSGKMPSSFQLERMANVILIQDIKDRTPDKMSMTEYAFLSPRQEKTRKKREKSLEVDTLNFLFQKEHKNLASTHKVRTNNKQDS
jgi:hypothetical protein